MAKQQNRGGDDVLLNINVTGREQLSEAKAEAKSLNSELEKGGKVDVSKPATSLKQQLREAILEAQRLESAGKKGTAEFRNAAKRVADIKDRIQELNKTFEAFDPDNKFKVFANTAAAGAKIVQGYAGAMTFLGVKSEDAQLALAKLQGIMAFTDAISSLADLKDTFKDLGLLLGVTKTKTQEVAAAQTESAAAATESAAVQVEAQTTVLTAAEASAAAQEASQAAVNEARAAGVTSIQELITIGNTAYEQTIAQTTATQAQTDAQLELNAAELAGAESAAAQTVATEGVAAAETEAAVAATGFGTALKLIGIGLIISALAYLITNFDKVKAAVLKLFPALADGKKNFDTLKEALFGVGNVILQYLVAPIKVIIDLIQGDFKKALADLKDGFNVVKNFQEGVNYEAKRLADEAEKERQKKQIEINERKIAELKALGKNTTKLELETNKLKQGQLDKDDSDYQKKKADLESEYTVIYNTELKRRNDKYKAALKTDLDAIKANEKENLKVIAENADTQRAIELQAVDYKYKLELDLLEKRKAANKNYNKDYADLVAARKIEEGKINKKYDDAFKVYTDKADQATQTEYEKRTAQIKKDFEDALKLAGTPQQVAKAQQTRAYLDNRNNAESIASSASKAANTALTRAQDINRPEDTDTPDIARSKVARLEEARLDAENAAYALKKAQLDGQNEELEQAAADHEKNLTDITEENAQSRKEIAEAEKEARLATLDQIGKGLEAAGNLLGENTVAGKALAVASATVSTYLSAQQAYASQLIPGDPSSPFRAALAAGVAVVAGLANVKKILSVKVPSKSGDTSSAGAGAAAPVINTTILNQANNGNQNVQKAVEQSNKDNANKKVEAYITNKSLKDNEDKSNYYNNQSTY